MAKKERSGNGHKRPAKRIIGQYDHKGKKRVNNPPVGLVTKETDPQLPTHRTYDYIQPVPSAQPGKNLDYDPHLDPQLVWAGKKEHTSFEVPTVSLHVHERIDPRTIIEAVRKRNGNGRMIQGSLFETKEENPPLRDAIDFYKHAHNWSNRLIAGDSLLVMNSLLEKEGMGGHVQTIYIDPPYGIKYGSNFQPFVNKRDVKDGQDEDLTQEPEMVRAFRDTWEFGIHSYLTYLRDRLLLGRELLHESGSCFVQISDENVHLVRDLCDEVFRSKNFVALISFQKTSGQTARYLAGTADYLLWYARDADRLKYRPLFSEKQLGGAGGSMYQFVELPNGERRRITAQEQRDALLLPKGSRPFRFGDITSQRQGRPSGPGSAMHFPVSLEGQEFFPPGSRGWTTTKEGMEALRLAGRLVSQGSRLAYVRYLDDFPAFELGNNWTDTAGTQDRIYVVQTNTEVIKRAVLMTTDPGDLVFDPTCGSGTTAVVAERWGRRWITCDTSRVATALAKQRLMTTLYDYYELAHPNEGVDSGFRYKTVSHVTLKTVANNEPPSQEPLYDQPFVDSTRARVTGPLTMEAVPAPTVQPLDEVDLAPRPADVSVSRSGPTLRDAEWREELLKTGIRGKGGQTINFSRVEPLGGTRWLHADAETKGVKPERVAISFGPEYAPLIGTQVESAWQEARTLIPRPSIIVFAAFQFDPQAAKDIDELTKEKTGMTFLTAQMNPDLLTEDLKKKRASNQSFWLIGRPDVELRPIKDGEHKGKWQAEVRGFDYFNTRTGTIESGDTSKIAMWLLDTDYDGRSLYPRQVFFPLADDDGGWARLAKNLKAEIDPELIEAYRGTVSLPFESGEHKRIAVKVIDDRGIESLKVLAFD
jgi:adenine-specific DNA-methyltransferase